MFKSLVLLLKLPTRGSDKKNVSTFQLNIWVWILIISRHKHWKISFEKLRPRPQYGNLLYKTKQKKILRQQKKRTCRVVVELFREKTVWRKKATKKQMTVCYWLCSWHRSKQQTPIVSQSYSEIETGKTNVNVWISRKTNKLVLQVSKIQLSDLYKQLETMEVVAAKNSKKKQNNFEQLR
jgi:hypothetical protein